MVVPGNMKPRHVVVEARMDKLAEDASSMAINKVEYNDTSIGFITCGIAYQYIKEAMPQASVLKTGHGEPNCPASSSKNLPQKLTNLSFLSELEPLIEEQVRSWGIQVTGKEIFTRQGEYSANMLP